MYPLLQLQRQHVDLQHEQHMQLFRNIVDARYQDTLTDIKAIKAHLRQTTGTSPPTVVFVETADAKKGEKDKEGLKLKPDAKAKPIVEIPKPYGTKKIDETLNLFSDEKQKRKERLETKGANRFEKEKLAQMGKEDIGTSKQRRKSTRKVRKPILTPSKTTDQPFSTSKPSLPPNPEPSDVGTPVVSTVVDTTVVTTDVTLTTAMITFPTTTHQISTPTRIPNQPPSPKLIFKIRKKTLVIDDDNIFPSPLPLSSQPVTLTSVSVPISTSSQTTV
ncbi:hypothetical protein Hanom_Chr14g01260801 [Helianthus anomalus]